VCVSRDIAAWGVQKIILFLLHQTYEGRDVPFRSHIKNKGNIVEKEIDLR